MVASKDAKFTVVIPTRERCDTLLSALRTCVSQDYDNLEIIVSDNFSQDDTKRVVQSFGDQRIRYINTGRRLSMSSNWEFALSHISDGYVTFIGDDDGLLPGALKDIASLIKLTGAEAISWRRAPYTWPSTLIQPRGNLLTVPLRASVSKRESSQMIRDVVSFRRSYCELPLVYNSMVSYSAIKRVIDHSGTFFHSMTPDVYSGFALACVLDDYLYSNLPYSIEGISRHSNGSYLFRVNSDTKQASGLFMSENDIPFHSKLVMCASLPIVVAEAFLQTQDHLSTACDFSLDMTAVLKTACDLAVYSPPEHFQPTMSAIKQIGEINGLRDYAVQLVSECRNRPRPPARLAFGHNPSRGYLLLDCNDFAVSDVYGASLLCKHALGLYRTGYLAPIGRLRTALGLVCNELHRRLH